MTFKESLEKVGDKIRSARLQQNISQKNLGRHIGQDVFYIQQLELGLLDPNVADLCVLISELNLKLSEFFADFENID